MTRRYFYPRSPCGERQGTALAVADVYKISIHALLAESDVDVLFQLVGGVAFLSTLSLRRATPAPGPCSPHANISIHALLAESDASILCTSINVYNFYPRSPCGERPYVFAAGNKAGAISIHALLAESD